MAEVKTTKFDWKAFYLSFNGRVNRQKFWLYYFIPFFCLYFLLGIVDDVLGEDISVLMAFVLLAFHVVSIWVGLAVGAKRCHDRGKSGWWLLLLLLPLIGFIWWLVDLGILPGTEGENQYGADPLK